MEAKMRVLKSTDDKSTRAIISIPGCAATGVLKSLHENKIIHDYMGLDQEGRMLMEVSFDKNHDSFMKKIHEYIKECEEIAHIFNQTIEEFIRKRNDEIDQMLSEHKRKSEERKRKSATILNFKV